MGGRGPRERECLNGWAMRSRDSNVVGARVTSGLGAPLRARGGDPAFPLALPTGPRTLDILCETSYPPHP